MPHATGADLPTELLLIILEYLGLIVTEQDDVDERRDSKHGLAALSIVCKHWLQTIWPVLFRLLTLRGSYDLLFLRRVVDSPRLKASPLLEEINVVQVHQDANEAKPWLVHLHWLSARLPHTIFECKVTSTVPSARKPAPFRSLPNFPPAYVRLYRLTLEGILFQNLAEAARLVRCFSVLTFCDLSRLAFVDPSPLHPRRTHRQAASTLRECNIADCPDISMYALATLACALLGGAPHVHVDPQAWDVVLHGLLAVVPPTFDRLRTQCQSVNDSLSTLFFTLSAPATADGVAGDALGTEIDIEQLVPGAPAHVERITFCCRFVDPGVAEELPWDVLQPLTALPFFRMLCFEASMHQAEEQRYACMHRVLCAVLRRARLAWALSPARIEFRYSWADEPAVTCEDILALPETHAVSNTQIVLEVYEQAEWLLRGLNETRRTYLQDLLYARRQRQGEGAVEGGMPANSLA